MNLFNRLVAILFALLLLALAGGFFALSDTVISDARSLFPTLEAVPDIVFFLAAGFLAVFALLVLIVELTPRRRREFVARVGDGHVQYPYQAVAAAIDRELLLSEGVRKAKTNVWGTGHEVQAHIRLILDAANSSPEAVNRAVARARSRVEDDFGLKLMHPRLSIERIEEGPARPRERYVERERAEVAKDYVEPERAEEPRRYEETEEVERPISSSNRIP